MTLPSANQHETTTKEAINDDLNIVSQKEVEETFLSTQLLRTKTSDTVNSKSISARRYSSCDDEYESLGPDLNRKLWLHKFPLISLAYFAINCTFFAINNSFTYPLLEVSSYTMNNGCVCCRAAATTKDSLRTFISLVVASIMHDNALLARMKNTFLNEQILWANKAALNPQKQEAESLQNGLPVRLSTWWGESNRNGRETWFVINVQGTMLIDGWVSFKKRLPATGFRDICIRSMGKQCISVMIELFWG